MTSLLDLVQSLESGLVDTKTASQKDTLRTLVNGLQAIPIDDVQDKEVQCLVEFLVSRLALADPDIICTILDGFLWLARAVRADRTRLLCPTQATHICKDGLFGQLIIQSLTKAPRLRVFRLLQLLLHDPHLSGLKTMGRSFLVAYVQAVDGEKDPECLTIIFDMNLVVIAQFELDEIQEDFFETMAAYFPINFTPPSGEGAPNISRASLSEGLHRCLFASRTFSAPYLLPLLCEKADSDWPQAQLDSLSLLADCLHGCLGSTDMVGELRGQSIALHHLTSYLILIAHVLEKMANKSISHKLEKLTRSCLTGLVHAYSSQTRDIHLLKNFVAMLLKTFGIVLDEAETNAPVGSIPIPPKLPTDQIQNYLLEAVYYSQPDHLLCGLLVDHLLRSIGSPLIHWSSTATDKIESVVTTLGPWQPFFALACRLLDACADSAQASGQLSMAGRQIYQGTLHLLTTFRAVLVADTSESELVESKVPYELVITIFGLSTRLSRYDSARDITTATELNQMIELFGLVIRRLDHKYPQVVPASKLDTMREELEAIVSHLYRSASSPTLELLNSILFGQIEANLNQTSSGSCLALILLQRAALTNPFVMARLFQFLLDETTSTGKDHRDLAFSSLISVLHFFAQTAAKSPVESCSSTMMRHLCDLLLNRLDVICRLMREQPTPSQCMAENLGTTFRIITGLSEDSQQIKLFEFFNTQPQSVLAYEPLTCVLFCSVIIALRGSVIETMSSSNIIRKLLQLATDTTPPVQLDNSIFEYVTVTVAQAYASVLNKCTEPLDSDISSHVVTTFDRLWNDSPSLNGLERFACHWLVACLQSLLAHPGPSRRVVFDKLSSVFLRSPEKVHRKMLETRLCELLEVLPTICSPGPPGSATSDVCHWEGTGLFVQKTFYLVTLPLAKQINALSDALGISSSTEQQHSVEQLKDAYLTAFLRLCLPLPTDLLELHLKELTHYVFLAITSSRSLHTQTAGLRLFCSIVDCVKSDPKQFTSRFSAGDMDDLFACLPRLLESTAGQTSDKMGSGYCAVDGQLSRMAALTRLSIARCLYSLVSLPAEVVGRHRDTHVLPVLVQLLDDPIRVVRTEASKANNAWLAHI
ncbi:mms19 nucleotide excision repair [Clonorchis sinensis]|uniref:MMS19 nucleotide excision repair protein n=1 Tax=Clonorchis sinensis TaxID=79923 RepID=A0A8T1MSK9_CLOSI|nr:mms19 nucleotide excision repair [Clonorchis sinensis]